MILPLALVTQLAGACAPQGAPRTLAAAAATGSRFDPLAVFDNTTHTTWRSWGRNEALALARHLISAGHAVDRGLMQIDPHNSAGHAAAAATTGAGPVLVPAPIFWLMIGGVG